MKRLNLLILIFLFSVISVSAADESIAIQIVDRSVKITGNAKVGEMISLWVLRPGIEHEALKTAGFADYETVSYSDQTQALPDGFSFEFSMAPNDTKGEYTAVLDGGNISKKFKYIPPIELSIYSDEINEANSTALAALLKNDPYVIQALMQFGSDNSVLSDLTSDSDILLWSEIFKEQGNFNSVNLNDISKRTNLIYKLNTDPDIYNIIQGNEALLDMDDIYAKIHLDIFDYSTQLNDFIASKRKFLTVGVTKSIMSEGLALVLLNNTRWGAMGDMLEKYKIAYPFNYSGSYSGLSEYVCKAISGKNFTSLEAAKKAFEESLSNNTGGNVSIPSTGGGGGGGGSVSGIIKSSENNFESINESKAFSDLENVVWAQISIARLSEAGIVAGDGTGKFYPNDNVTREQFIKMLVLSFGLYNADAQCTFTDVSKDHWAYSYIASAVESGIVNGVGDNQFGLERLITRQELAAMADRVSKKAGYAADDKEPEFDDSDTIAEYAYDAVGRLSNAGIINGMGDNKFEPELFATRAQSAVIICRLLDLGNEQ